MILSEGREQEVNRGAGTHVEMVSVSQDLSEREPVQTQAPVEVHETPPLREQRELPVTGAA